ncbi:MAG TPA: hypothetical protein VN944_06295, partial [Nitrospiria bacterium]|nr:hypothetical protein [Nitrospiria bacterium]
MYNTYRFRHPAFPLRQNGGPDQFFQSSVIFALFLYFISFYFAYQTADILKHLHGGQQTVTLAPSLPTAPGSQSLHPDKSVAANSVAPPMVNTGTVAPPFMKPQAIPLPTAPPLDIPRIIDNASHEI